MIRVDVRLVFLLSFLGFAGPTWGAELKLSSADRLLILAPHPDDEVLCCGGMIQQAVQDHIPVKIVFLTYGDNNAWAFTMYRHFPVFRPKTMLKMGRLRREETLAAATVLGVPLDQLIFLGYPDFGTLTIWNDHWGRSPAYKSRMTCVQAVPYDTAYRPGAAYKGEEILADLKSIIKEFRPTHIFIPHPEDLQPDHHALYLFARAALRDLVHEVNPQIYSYLIHFKSWPPRRGLHKDLALDPPSSVQTQWFTFPLTAPQVDEKYQALKKYRTQWAYSRRFMTAYVRRNELFGDAASLPMVNASEEKEPSAPRP